MLKELLKKYNLDNEKIDLLNQLREIVLEYNQHTNLTSLKDEEEFNIKHILDSLSILDFYDLDSKSILDVGSGGGFPGLALSIVLPNSEITMIDSNNKKIEFIDRAIKKLNLSNSSTIYSRVETADIDSKFDVVISRAVAPLNILLEITFFASKKDGKLIYYKGINLKDELPNKWNNVEDKLGIEFEKIEEFNLDKELKRTFISFKKIKDIKNFKKREYSHIKKTPIF